jgi:Uma2 family endonuclease
VSAQSLPEFLTVEAYEKIANPPGGRYELHHGQLVFMTYPLRPHKALQRRLREMLEPAAKPRGFLVDTEYPYRPPPQREVWSADVACLKQARDNATEKWLQGSPELVIEVGSPSNGKDELHDKAMTTLAGDGAMEFWIVDTRSRCVTVYSKTSGTRAHTSAADPPFVACLGVPVSLDFLFSPL